MFITVRLKDVLKIPPRYFGKPAADAIRDEIDRKYSNRVLPDVGLCLCAFDLLKVSEGKVLYGDGCVYHKVEFTIAVFRPFIGEAIVGRVAQSTEQGITVSTGFFDDIHLPPRHLQFPSAYDPAIGEHFWAPTLEGADPNEELQLLRPEVAPYDTRLHLQRHDPVRVRVEEESFAATGPKEPPKAAPPVVVGAEGPIVGPFTAGPSPYLLVVSTQGAGMGLLDWWKAAAEHMGGDELQD